MGKRGIVILFFLVLFASFASADLLVTQQPNNLYNLGDVVNVQAKVVTNIYLSNFLTIELICNGIATEVHKEFVVLEAGEEKEINARVPLSPEFLGRSSGTCKTKTSLGEESLLSNEFSVSDKITITLKSEKALFAPGESIQFEGEAVKETGELVKGFVEVKLEGGVSPIEILDSVNNGYFMIDFVLPENTKAGSYVAFVKVYEKDISNMTSKGETTFNLDISQVPTSLELVFESEDVEPGTSLNVKGVLHDQTGENMPSTVIITVTDNKGAIVEQAEIASDEYLSVPIEYNEPSAEWNVKAISENIEVESSFNIVEKAAVDFTIVNETLFIRNVGNVVYNKTVLVKIGESVVNVPLNLGVDKETKYTLSAPDGEYSVEVLEDGESKFNAGNVFLTGNAIDVKQAGAAALAIVRHPIVWLFVIIVLGFVGFIVYRKGYKRSFIGRMIPGKINADVKPVPLASKSLVKTRNRAELSLSLKGDKQDVSVVSLKIKNLKDIQSHKGGAEETVQKLVNISEDAKAFVYENQDYLFFIFAPVVTRTFKNEKAALHLANHVVNVLKEHNKMFKQKVDFGISLNYGSIVAKLEKAGVLKFMSMGTLVTNSKKVSSVSDGEILLSEKMNEKMISLVKTHREERQNVPVYTIKEMKLREESKQFISNFVKKLEGKK